MCAHGHRSEVTPDVVSLKQFIIKELIAKGGMAEIYRAQAVGAEGF